MNNLKDSIRRIVDQMWHRGQSNRLAEEASLISGELSEDEEQVDLYINPVQGVTVIRHSVSRHPRRA